MSDHFRLNEEQMARIEPYFSLSHGVPRVDDRRVLSGVIHVGRSALIYINVRELLLFLIFDLGELWHNFRSRRTIAFLAAEKWLFHLGEFAVLSVKL